MPISVVIAAHDEERVIARCLEAMLQGAGAEELEIVVVCNGCTDLTADVARGYAARAVRVMETPVASKTSALNLGETEVVGFPRFYVDADVTLPLTSIRRIAARLEGGALAASPVMTVDLRGAGAAVRFSRFIIAPEPVRNWHELPRPARWFTFSPKNVLNRSRRGRNTVAQ